MDQNLLAGSVFAAGLLSFFSPCILPLLPVYFGILTDQNLSTPASAQSAQGETKRADAQNLARTLLFIAGISVSFILLGFGAGGLSVFFTHRAFTVIGGILMILFGLIQLGAIRSNFHSSFGGLNLNPEGKNRYFYAFLLGFILSLGWTPCIGPILGSVLMLAANGGTALKGALFMALYSLGLAVPFLVILLFSDTLLKKVKNINRWLPVFKKVGGVFLMIIGGLLIANRLMG